MKKKRTWKFWTSRTLLLLFLIGIFWLINLIWFRPFNIKHFYDKLFVELAIDSPELTTSIGIPFLYDQSKDELDDISDACLLYTSPSPRDRTRSRMPSSA